MTQREIAFINDIAKELINDVIGQTLVLHQVNAKLTDGHDVYNESVRKAFDNPVRLGAIVSATVQEDTKIGNFGIDSSYKVEAYVSYRDILDRGVEIKVGDFFSYGDKFYEITQLREVKNVYGEVENKAGVVINATVARDDQFKARLHGPTDVRYTDEDAVQDTFVQQRGLSENSQGETGDSRQLDVVIDKPLTGTREVSPRGKSADDTNPASSFYGDE